MASASHPLLLEAAALLREGKAREAIGPLRRAASLDPSDARVQHDLGLACLESGRLEEAISALRRAVTCNPRYADAHFRLGIALEKLGDLPEAVASYDRATTLLPSLTEAWFRAGALVFTLGHRQEAVGCFLRAAASGPRTGFGRLARARALLADGRDADAERVLRQLLALDRKNAMALDLLGNVLADAGRFEEAWSCFARAIEAAPLMAGSTYDLVRCRRLTEADRGLLAGMDAALADPRLDDDQRLRLHLARGKAAADFGDPEGAMRNYDAATALRHRVNPFDAAAFGAEVDRMVSRFTPSAIASSASLGSADPSPILVVGMPRSGTTLVEQVVSSHQDVAGGGELNFWNERGQAWLAHGAPFTDGKFLDQAARAYLAVLRGLGPSAERTTDKMPFNFLWAGLVHLALPHATILHCRRAAIDTALSIHGTYFSAGLHFPTGGTELVTYLQAYERLTDHWRRVLPPERFVEVNYAALTADPEPAIRRIVGACGLGWNAACLHPERNMRAVRTASRWQARQPIYRQDPERWRGYARWLGPLRELAPDEGEPDDYLTE